jgi:hypothetical protein
LPSSAPLLLVHRLPSLRARQLLPLLPKPPLPPLKLPRPKPLLPQLKHRLPKLLLPKLPLPRLLPAALLLAADSLAMMKAPTCFRSHSLGQLLSPVPVCSPLVVAAHNHTLRFRRFRSVVVTSAQ